MNRPPISSQATPWGAIFSTFLALFYGASPIDLIPDIIPILGWMDDAAIVPMLLVFAFFQYRKVQKQNERKAQAIILPPK